MEFSPKWAMEKELSLFVPQRATPKTQRQFFYNEYWKIIYEIISKLPKNAKILDLGCGRGTISQYLVHAGYENVTLLDNSDEALALARANLGYGAKLINADALKTGLIAGTFDAVISMGVSEHIDNYPRFFYEQLRILKKGGWLICMTVPKKRSIQVLNIFGSDRFYRSQNTVAEYKKLLERLTDFPVAEMWVNPYPLFTPIPRFLDRTFTSMYLCVNWLRAHFMQIPFSGSEKLCQAHFLVTRRSS